MTGYAPHRGRFQRGAASPADLVPAAVKAERQHEAEAAEVTRVLVRVERGDGTVREYEAVEPRTCEVSTGLAVSGASAGPTLSLWLTANQRHNLHIRTHGPWKLLSEEAHSALAGFLAAMGYTAQ